MDGSLILHRLGPRKRVLLLQGPSGTFFHKLYRFLSSTGFEVLQVNFNSADEFFNASDNARAYSGQPKDWPTWLAELIRSEDIQSIILFGDCRPMHRQACRIAGEHKLQVLVFEEGYLRPGFVTCEADGVNARSPVAAAFVHEQPALLGLMPLPETHKIVMPPSSALHRMTTVLAMGTQAAIYLLAMRIGRKRFPHYVHHKSFRLRREASALMLNAFRKLAYRFSQAATRRALAGKLGRQSFIVPLQVYNDSQITHHSHFKDQEQLIWQLTSSFAANAKPEDQLVFKHHPMDRGHRHYGRAIRAAAKKHDVDNRVHYVHDLHLPSVLRHARGMVTINSTAGLSALYHGVPIKCLGKCVYDLPGLTYQGSLNQFWQTCPPPIGSEVLRLRSLLAQDALIPGSFYLGAIHSKTANSVVPNRELGKDQWGRGLAKQTDFGNRQNVHTNPVFEQPE